MDTNGTTFNGLLSATTVAKATENKVTFDSIKKISERLAKKQASFIDKFYADFIDKHGYAPMVYFHKEYMNDWENNKFKVIMTPRAYGKTYLTNLQLDQLRHQLHPPTWVGIDLGKEDDMCTEGTGDYEKDRLRETVRQYEENHLGATTERFIEMAREGGRSEHLGNKVREQEQKIYDLSQALMRANEQVSYSDNETQKANKRAEAWQERAIRAENLYYSLREKNRKAKATAKKPAKKTSK